MKTKSQIEFDYKKAMKQVEEIENIAKKLQTLIDDKYTPTFQGIDKLWKSDNTSAFFEKGLKIRTNLVADVKKLKDTARTLRDIATNIYNAEMQSLQIAQQRTYK